MMLLGGAGYKTGGLKREYFSLVWDFGNSAILGQNWLLLLLQRGK